jgi:sugar (pentulose or hexulose) kinase
MALARLTGSRAYERFTGAQIRKFATESPVAYANTDRIHLVSSFMASLLAGRHAPIEPGDGAGMNLMDLAAHAWAPAALDATAPELERRLPPIRDSWSVAGELSPYWQRRYGFGPARVIAWTGDNPSSLIGLGLIEPGDARRSRSARATPSSAVAGRRTIPRARATSSVAGRAATWRSRASRTDRWRASACATSTGWTGTASRPRCATRPPATAAA